MGRGSISEGLWSRMRSCNSIRQEVLGTFSVDKRWVLIYLRKDSFDCGGENRWYARVAGESCWETVPGERCCRLGWVEAAEVETVAMYQRENL